ncbi:MAG: hypothetical protein ABIN24_12950 [Dyadobacter sp.]
MKELQQYGYLRYDPSYHPLRGSWVYLFQFDADVDENQSIICLGTGQVVDKHETTAGQPEDKLTSETIASKGIQSPLNIYKHNKHIKLSFLKKHDSESNDIENIGYSIPEMPGTTKEKNLNASFHHDATPSTTENPLQMTKPSFEIIPQTVETVIDFFLVSAYPKGQATKFFHYYSATGWKLGGKSQIKNWHAAAHSWMLNAENSVTDAKSERRETGANRLHTKPDKNYSEPL